MQGKASRSKSKQGREVVEVVEVVAAMVGRVVRVGSQPWRASGCGSSELQSGG